MMKNVMPQAITFYPMCIRRQEPASDMLHAQKLGQGLPILERLNVFINIVTEIFYFQHKKS